MNHPIVIAAFGTTTAARKTYAFVDDQLKKRFAGHEIFWAYNSRIVRKKLKNRSIDLPPPAKVLSEVAAKGYEWAVVQSLNMICGHEFDRLKDEVLQAPLRVSIGHSLLCGYPDFLKAAEAMAPFFNKNSEEAVVFAGHGTDHCAWSAYPAFEKILAEQYGPRAFAGAVEGEWADCERVACKVEHAGFDRVRIVPMMLVAGVHFKEDLAGSGDSWKSVFEARNITVFLENEGLGTHPGIVSIFGDHIESALDVIPRTGVSFKIL